MSNDPNAGIKGMGLVAVAYIVTVIVVIIIVAVSLGFLIDTHKCSSLGPALLALWGTTAVVFLVSVVAVRIAAWRIISSTAWRWIALIAYGMAVLVTYVVIAFGLLVAFNC